MEKTTIFTILVILFLTFGIFITTYDNKNLTAQNKDLTAQNELLRTENTAQLKEIIDCSNVINFQDEYYTELEPKECPKIEQNNTALLELFNKCTFLDPNKQYIAFDIGVNVTEMLKPKIIHSSSTKTITEYIICDKCPSIAKCPLNKVMQCSGVDECGCQTDCSCVANNIN